MDLCWALLCVHGGHPALCIAPSVHCPVLTLPLPKAHGRASWMQPSQRVEASRTCSLHRVDRDVFYPCSSSVPWPWPAECFIALSWCCKDLWRCVQPGAASWLHSVPSCPADPPVRPTPLCQHCITVPEGPHINAGYFQALFARAVKFSVAKTELLLSDLEERFSSSVMVSPGDCFLSAIYVIAVLGFLWIFILHLRFIRRWHVPISRNGARLSCLSWLLKLHAVFLF